MSVSHARQVMASPWLSWDESSHVQDAREYVEPLPTGQHAIAKEMRKMKEAMKEEEGAKKARRQHGGQKAKRTRKEVKRQEEPAPKKEKRPREATTRSKKRIAIQDKDKVLSGQADLGPVPQNAKLNRNALYSWAYHANETVSKKAGLDDQEMKESSRRKARAVAKEHFG